MLKTQPAALNALSAVKRRPSICTAPKQRFSNTSAAAALSPYKPAQISANSTKDIRRRGQSTTATQVAESVHCLFWKRHQLTINQHKETSTESCL